MRTILEGLKLQPSVDDFAAVTDTGFTNGHAEVTYFNSLVTGGGQAGLSRG